jgi:DNA-binding response OmpR family regulator
MEQADILFLNDGSPLFAWLGNLLATRGYGVVMTDAAGQALTLLRSRRLIMVVVTVDGEGRDRLEVLPQVRSLAPRARLLVISSQRLLPEAALEVEADDYLFLPARPLEVWRRLMALLPAPATRSAPRRAQLLHPKNVSVLNRLLFLLLDVQRCLASSTASLQELRRTLTDGVTAEQQGLLTLLHHRNRNAAAAAQDFLDVFFRNNFQDLGQPDPAALAEMPPDCV